MKRTFKRTPGSLSKIRWKIRKSSCLVNGEKKKLTAIQKEINLKQLLTTSQDYCRIKILLISKIQVRLKNRNPQQCRNLLIKMMIAWLKWPKSTRMAPCILPKVWSKESSISWLMMPKTLSRKIRDQIRKFSPSSAQASKPAIMATRVSKIK